LQDIASLTQTLVLLVNHNSGVLTTMRKCKLAILAIAVLLQVHTGAGSLFGQDAQNPQPQPITR
jgi:hypothetical protein